MEPQNFKARKVKAKTGKFDNEPNDDFQPNKNSFLEFLQQKESQQTEKTPHFKNPNQVINAIELNKIVELQLKSGMHMPMQPQLPQEVIPSL